MASSPSTPADYRAARSRAMPEAELLANVIDAAERFGWLWHHNYDSRRSRGKGLPDLFLARKAAMIATPSELLVVELKTAIGRTSRHQDAWLDHFRSAGIEVATWRPADWLSGDIAARLARKEG